MTGGRYDWDAELVAVMPRVVTAGDADAGRAAILGWCRKLGDPSPRADAGAGKAELHLDAPIGWIRDEKRLGHELSAWLVRVHERRHAGGAQHYVRLNPGVGNPRFTNERWEKQQSLPDAGRRILALFRFWNIIEYWFPYRDVIGEDWHAVLDEFLPRLVAARTEDAYKLSMMALIARVKDSHANLWNGLDVRPPRGAYRVPAKFRFVEGKATVVESSTKALRPGDVIVAVDGRPVAELLKEWTPFYAASNPAARHRDFARSLAKGETKSCRLRVERAGKPFERTVERTKTYKLSYTNDRSGPTFQMLSKDVGYLKLSSVDNKKAREYLGKAMRTKGLVIDIRNYPSSFMVFALGSHLVREVTPFARFTNGDTANPGRFRWSPTVRLAPRQPVYAGKIVILVDETSQSSAEYTAMAFRIAPGAVVVGSTTAGADGNISHIPLPGGLRTMISGIGVFYPDKRPTQRIGIRPDVAARPTIAGIAAGRDEVLEVGIRQILGPDAPAKSIRHMAMRTR